MRKNTPILGIVFIFQKVYNVQLYINHLSPYGYHRNSYMVGDILLSTYYLQTHIICLSKIIFPCLCINALPQKWLSGCLNKLLDMFGMVDGMT